LIEEDEEEEEEEEEEDIEAEKTGRRKVMAPSKKTSTTITQKGGHVSRRGGMESGKLHHHAKQHYHQNSPRIRVVSLDPWLFFHQDVPSLGWLLRRYATGCTSTYSPLATPRSARQCDSSCIFFPSSPSFQMGKAKPVSGTKKRKRQEAAESYKIYIRR